MSEARDEGGLRRFVRRHHVYFTVELEWVIGGGGRWPVGFAVRFFATHGRGVRALPAGARSRALAASLRSLAESLLPECPPRARVEVEPFRPALYDSREVPGTDEVALTIRLFREFAREARPVGPPEESCLKELRRRSKLLSLRER